MFKLASLIENPGEPAPASRYRDPAHLAELGFNGLVFFESTSVSGVGKPERVGGGEMGPWVAQRMDELAGRIEAAGRAGLATYLTYDAMSLPAPLYEAEVEALGCRNATRTICPASEPALARAVEALGGLLGQLPEVDGVVLRLGDTDADRYPHLVGGELYRPHCPRCARVGRVDRLARWLEAFHRFVVEERGQRLIARAWNVRPGGVHDSPRMAASLAERLPGEPGDDRLILSFKFTETDFWRYQRWNRASLVFGDRPILYELQCQREFEAKGGLPDYQVPLWRDGHPELAEAGERDFGLAEVSERVNLAGLWAWVRGGGWGGPFLADERWVDANVWAVCRLADDPCAEPAALARQWARRRLGIDSKAGVEGLAEVLEASTEWIRHAFYVGPYARSLGTAWHANGDLVQDDVVDARAAWRIVQRLDAAGMAEAVREKESAVRKVGEARAAMERVAAGTPALEPLAHTLIWGESLLETLRDLLAGLAAYRRWKQGDKAAHAREVRRRLHAAQASWNHHTQRHGTLPGAATPFREVHFWELTQRLLEEVEVEGQGERPSV